MEVNWHLIRTINNSRNDGFEEFVCQLAAKENIPDSRKFVRVGKPDGGKECFWELNNGSVIGWQAKYFTEALKSSHWSQIEESVISAIDNHPNLSEYYIAIPYDLPDGKTRGQSALAKWNKKVDEWQLYASRKRMSTKFVYWGSHDLIKRISSKENEGFRYFWFSKEEFADEWFESKNNESINALENRYTPELNVSSHISQVFDGFERSTFFQEQLHQRYDKIFDEFRHLRLECDNDSFKSHFVQIENSIAGFKELYEASTLTGVQPIPFDKMSRFIADVMMKVDDLRKNVRAIQVEYEAVKRKEGITGYIYDTPHARLRSAINSLQDALDNFSIHLNRPLCLLANSPYLLVAGEAGIGKSHLFADIIKQRKERNQLSLLLLGERFITPEMAWTQILNNQLRKPSIDEFVFLGALNAKAEAMQSRIIVFIDALNEGEGRKIWKNELKSFIQSFKNYPWLGLALSIRDTYADYIAPASIIDQNFFIRITHTGFAGFEDRAVKIFFNHYGLVLPEIPLLNPEFHNALFLKLFCKSLHDRGLSRIPPGLDGITMIIEYYLESVDLKLSGAAEWDYDAGLKLVRKVVSQVMDQMIADNKDYVRYDEVATLAESIFQSRCNRKEPCLPRLISEGVFNRDMRHDGNEYIEVIYFAYQRFHDHVKTARLLDEYLRKRNPLASIKKGKISELLKSNAISYYSRNIIESLCIQLPEKTGKELMEVFPSTERLADMPQFFLKSLIWRKPETIKKPAHHFIRKFIMDDEYYLGQFLETIISLTTRAEFPYNADYLHGVLLNKKLAERDSHWTIWLQDKYGKESQPNSIKRLIDWAWNDDNKSSLSDISILLAATTIAWLLTSPNRYLRDAATKSLVSLLQDRIRLFIPLLEKFKDVNDPYVLERIYAAAYGAAIRKKINAEHKSLALYVYRIFFDVKNKMVFPHILLRDYARGIIEFALTQHAIPEIDTTKIRPPYRSKKIPKILPTNKEIDKKYKPVEPEGDYGKSGWGVTAILNSMTTEYGRGTGQYGDFGRYTFEAALDDWSVNTDLLSNYAVQRIFELGYDSELFTEFDLERGSGRHTGNEERMGKKYQWIVLHELLARISDHLPMKDESYSRYEKKLIPYEGPWQPSVRDIDPSLLIKETAGEFWDKGTTAWWFDTVYKNYDKSPKEWINLISDFPDPLSIIQKKDPCGKEWVWLEIHPRWTEKLKPGEDRYSERRNLNYYINSYLLPNKNAPAIQRNLEIDGYTARMPQTQSFTRVFSREFYWSQAFHYFSKQWYNGEDWFEVHTGKNPKTPIGELQRTAQQIHWEEEYDCSKNSTITFYKPSLTIFKKLGLSYSDREGELIGANGELLCFDPGVNHNTISGLIVRKDKLIEFLHKEDLSILWWLNGEKNIIGGSMKRGDEYLGRQLAYGVYWLDKKGINGKINFKKE